MVTIPDTNLQVALRAPEALNLPTGDITVEDLQTLTSLDLGFKYITDLTGLEFATNLENLDLGYNFELINLSSISSLPSLTHLDLSNCHLVNLTPLSTIATLQSLELRGLVTDNLEGLETLTQLRELNLRQSRIGNLSALQYLTELRVLDLGYTEISDLTPLATLTNIQELDLTYTPIEDISPLSQMTQMEQLTINNSNISDLSALQHMHPLKNLSISHCPVSDLTPLGGLTELTHLTLAFLQLSDVSSLKSLHQLERLYLTGNHLEDFDGGDDQADMDAIRENNPSLILSSFYQFPLIPDPQLHQLLTEILRGFSPEAAEQPLKDSALRSIKHIHPDFFGISGITDLTGLQYCTNLQTLSLMDSDVQDLEPLAHLSSLTEIYLDGNQNMTNLLILADRETLHSLSLNDTGIDQVDFLATLPNLQWLDLGNNQISDISPLMNTTSIRTLNLASNQLTSLQGLTNLSELNSVFLEGNPLPLSLGNPSVVTIIALQQSGVDVTYDFVERHQTAFDFQASQTHWVVGPIFLRDQVTIQRTTDLTNPDGWQDLTGLEPLEAQAPGEWRVDLGDPFHGQPAFYRAIINPRY